MRYTHPSVAPRYVRDHVPLTCRQPTPLCTLPAELRRTGEGDALKSEALPGSFYPRLSGQDWQVSHAAGCCDRRTAPHTDRTHAIATRHRGHDDSPP